MVAVILLGLASASGIAYSIARDSTPARPVAGSRANPTFAAPPPEPAPSARTASPTLRIRLNSATRAELELLPGIGPALADRIIAERARGGAFLRVDDLTRVRGIGARTIERLRPLVDVSE